MKISQIKLEFKLRYLWVGVFWTSFYSRNVALNLKEYTWGEVRTWIGTDIWICVLPCVPVHITLANSKIVNP